MGARDLPVGRIDGEEVVVDGYQGRVYLRPSAAVKKEFLRLAGEESELSQGLSELRQLPAETIDGYRIPLLANTGLASDILPSLQQGAEGIGLYRTEVPFLVRERFPSEDEQTELYRRVLRSFAPRPVVLRTLDVGGDKPLAYFPIEEENPFLGWRGVRITLDHPEIFMTQLRAMLRASVGVNNLQVLFPMIGSVHELEDAQALLERAIAELLESGEPVQRPQVGVMIEVPSAVFQVDALARRADFLSIGSNDLAQYLLAVDRNNPHVAELYDTLHPSVLRALQLVIDGGHAHGRPVGICGEMAGQPAAAVLLLGMGIDSLSMNAASLSRVKWVIRSFSQAEARELMLQALQLESAAEVRRFVYQALERAGVGGLVRAGK
ncbi:MAG TPA: phosphoenolpyruvate--protein phosphotransferase, partial [Gammaproteobacteria bacterium]